MFMRNRDDMYEDAQSEAGFSQYSAAPSSRTPVRAERSGAPSSVGGNPFGVPYARSVVEERPPSRHDHLPYEKNGQPPPMEAQMSLYGQAAAADRPQTPSQYSNYSSNPYAASAHETPRGREYAQPSGPAPSSLTPEAQAAVEYYADYYANYYQNPAAREYYTQYYTAYYMQQQAAAQGQGHQPPPQATHRPAPAPPREKKKDRTGQYTVQMEGPSSAYSMGLSNGDAKSEAVTASAYRGGPGSIGSAPSAPPAPSDDGPATGKRKPKNVKPPKPFVSRQDQEHKMQKVKRIDYDAPPPAGPFVTFFGMIFGTWVRGHMKPLSALLMYTFLFLITSGFQWAFRGYSDELLQFTITKQLVKPCAGDGRCVGKEAVLRIALANTMFFSLMFFLTFGAMKRSDLRFKIHTGFWLPKLAVWSCCIIGCFYMSHTTIEQYSLGAKVISGVWLVVMILTLLDSVYSLNRFLLTDMNNGWFKLQIAVLIIMTVATYCAGSAEIGMSGWLYMKDRDKCGTEIAFAATTAVLALIYTLISLLPHRYEDSGLVTSGCVFAYCAFLAFSALSSGSKTACRRYPPKKISPDEEPTWIVIVSFVLACLSIAWSAIITAYDQMPIARGMFLIFGVQNKDQRENRTIVSHHAVAPGYGDRQRYDTSYEDHDREAMPYRPEVMHFLYAMAASYMGMVLTSWSTRGTALRFEADKGFISMWVKMGSSWVVALLYGWTVLVPEIKARMDPYYGFD